MINRTIKVEYLRRREDSKIGLTSEDLVKPGQIIARELFGKLIIKTINGVLNKLHKKC